MDFYPPKAGIIKENWWTLTVQISITPTIPINEVLVKSVQQVRSSAAENLSVSVKKFSVNSRDRTIVRRIRCVHLIHETVPFRLNNVSLEIVYSRADVTIFNWIIRTFSSPGETNRSLRWGNKRKRVAGRGRFIPLRPNFMADEKHPAHVERSRSFMHGVR